MRIETIFILNSAGKRVPIGTIKLREVEIGRFEIAGGGNIIYDYYVDNIMLNVKEGDKL